MTVKPRSSPNPSNDRPKNTEVENEMVRPPAREGEPPRPATEPPHKSAPVAAHQR
jgi:hypothetical protein